MKSEQRIWTAAKGWVGPDNDLGEAAQLVLVFGTRALLQSSERRQEIHLAYPKALLFGCSTAGEICSSQVADDSLVVTAVHFERVRVRGTCVRIDEAQGSEDLGRRLAGSIDCEHLVHVVVLSDGLQVNGTELVQGLSEALPPTITITGGLSGDGSAFKETCVVFGDQVDVGLVAAVAFYGTALRVGFGSQAGWNAFGPERLITRSQGNVLFSLDERNALELYKRYLGDFAAGLPASALHFPLAVRNPQTNSTVVRAILGVDEASGSMIFAGNVPEGHLARLMKWNVAGLIDGATGAANIGLAALGNGNPQLALLISCLGRRLVLKQRIEEELEAVRNVLGSEPAITGFYSYGEICPIQAGSPCELQNESMTVTFFTESGT